LASTNDGQLFYIEKTTFRSVFANNSVFNFHFMKVSTENDNNFGYEKITIVVDNIPLIVEVVKMFQNTILKGIVFIPWLLGILELCPLIC
jgi:hypothetical protein